MAGSGVQATGNLVLGGPEEIRTVVKEDPDYPDVLRAYRDMPETLYLIGSLPEDVPTVAMVGARLCSSYGKEQAYRIARFLSSRGVQVVSGMAAGIDSFSHEGALDGGGRTYAVLGCGVDICYPATGRILYRRVASSGGLISEVAPGYPPIARNFPLRNRIISALSDAVIVIEAKARSGSLITADHALEQGKDIFALPGHVDSMLSAGCHYLIAQGAHVIWSYEALYVAIEQLYASGIGRSQQMTNTTAAAEAARRKTIRERDIVPPDPEKDLRLVRLGGEAKLVFAALSAEPRGMQELIDRTHLSLSVVQNAVVSLFMEDLCEEVSRGYYVRKA